MTTKYVLVTSGLCANIRKVKEQSKESGKTRNKPCVLTLRKFIVLGHIQQKGVKAA